MVGELERSGGLYQRDLVRFLRRRLEPDAVVVDGGAHVGVLTVLMASLCPAGHVYAFEPVPENRAHLAANLAANGAGNVSVEPAALYDLDGELAMEFDAAYPGGSHVGRDGERAAAVRLDSWGRRLDRLDLLKLDVEGAELAALRGAEDTIRRLSPLAVVECNPVALARFGDCSYRDLLARMRSLFFAVGVIGPSGRVSPVASPRHLGDILGAEGVVDLVGLPARPSAVEWGPATARALAHRATLRATSNRWRAPGRNFVVDPEVDLSVGTPRISGAPGEIVRVPVVVRNRSRFWLSSRFDPEAVHVSYRFLDEAGSVAVPDGHRTAFPAPLGPGRATGLDATVQLPAHPGRYQLLLTLVQEHFAWLDSLDPACAARVPATVG